MWKVAWYALLQLAVLSIFSLIGGVIFVRRKQVGFEPRSSPEMAAAAAEVERIKRRSRALDEAYGLVRAREYRRAAEPLRQWLSGLNAQYVTMDVRAIMTQAAQWNSDRALAEVSHCVVTYLIQIAKLDLALESLTATLGQLPSYALGSEDETVALASHAKGLGDLQLARTILKHFAARDPSYRLGVAAKTLLRDLEP
jgi:hypothetical protein